MPHHLKLSMVSFQISVATGFVQGMRNSDDDDKHLLSLALHMLDVLVNLILTKFMGKVLRHKEVRSGLGFEPRQSGS